MNKERNEEEKKKEKEDLFIYFYVSLHHPNNLSENSSIF
jgi:hypothetical protein